VLDVDLDGIPRLTLSAHEISAQDLLEWFHVGIDTIDNETDVIG
jgi:hypothetical protein